MNSLENAGDSAPEAASLSSGRFVPIAAGLAAIAFTYAASVAEIGVWKIVVVAGIAVLFVAACGMVNRTNTTIGAVDAEEGRDRPHALDDVEDRLIALDEANEVFGTSLNAADMFRLVSSRVGEIFPFAAAALIVPDEKAETLKFIHADGLKCGPIRDVVIGIGDGLAGSAFASGSIEIEQRLSKDLACLGASRVAGFASAAAIPLLHDDQPFGVFELFTSEPIEGREETLKLLEAIGEHVTPIFKNSLAFERSLSNALTDTLTGLPNERAFYMVLENQLAESIRHRDERPLTILSIDIRDFGAVNSMLGHPAGDRMLEFTGAHIGEHLRKMDFLARTVNDEFSVVLPTASEKIAFEIIERIKAGFSQNEFEIADGEGVVVALNVGWATFWKDGETAEQLIRAAQQRKRQAKSEQPAEVLWFPKEYVN